MIEQFAVNTNFIFPAQFAEHHLEAGSEELGRQMVALGHSFLDGYANDCYVIDFP